MSKKYLVFFPTAAAVIIIDQLTKAWVTNVMTLHESLPLIPGFFSLTYVRNPGAAFGFLSQAHPQLRFVFFVLISLLALGLILYYIIGTTEGEMPLVFSLSLIMGGAAGNLIDRVRFGEVVDFLDVYIGTHHWPAFNAADSAISIGAVLMALQMLTGRKEE